MPFSDTKREDEEFEENVDPAKVIKDNFSVENTLEQLLADVDEQLKTKSISIETAHEIRKVYRSYLTGNTAVSFTTDKFIQVTTIKLVFSLGKLLGKDYYKGKDLNRVLIDLDVITDVIALALKRALGGKERSLFLRGFKVFSNPAFEKDYQEDNKIL